jgi:Flp pilus assembly protein TadD
MIAFESDHIQALYADHPSDFLLITFATATMRANGRRFFCSNLADRGKIATLGFVATRPNWYPQAEMAKAIEAVQPILERFAERVCIGYSMGGFATIKYARALRSTTSIAICPQFSVDPSDIPPQFENALRETMAALKVQRSDLDRDMRITSRSEYGRMFALYDNRDAAELAHLARIEEQVAITKIDLPYTRHDTHRCFSELEALTQLVALCRKGDAASARAFAQRQRKSVSARAFNLGLILAERHSGWALKLYTKHQAALETKERCTLAIRLAQVALDGGNTAWSVAVLEKLTARHKDNLQAHRLLLTAYLRLNDLACAVGILRRLTALSPNDAGLWEKLVGVLLRVPDVPAARAEAERALDVFPGHPGLLHLASDVALREGETEEAIHYLRRSVQANPCVRARNERLAYLLLEAGRIAEAEAQFGRMLQRDPQDAGAQRGLAALRARPRIVPQVRLLHRAMPAARAELELSA